VAPPTRKLSADKRKGLSAFPTFIGRAKPKGHPAKGTGFGVGGEWPVAGGAGHSCGGGRALQGVIRGALGWRRRLPAGAAPWLEQCGMTAPTRGPCRRLWSLGDPFSQAKDATADGHHPDGANDSHWHNGRGSVGSSGTYQDHREHRQVPKAHCHTQQQQPAR
jgi:hypothetical protein